MGVVGSVFRDGSGSEGPGGYVLGLAWVVFLVGISVGWDSVRAVTFRSEVADSSCFWASTVSGDTFSGPILWRSARPCPCPQMCDPGRLCGCRQWSVGDVFSRICRLVWSQLLAFP